MFVIEIHFTNRFENFEAGLKTAVFWHKQQKFYYVSGGLKKLTKNV